jgi:hypothetical protein
MVRKQLYITEEQDAKLKRIAAARGSTEADVARSALEALTEPSYEPVAPEAPRIREAALKERYMTEEYLGRVSADERRIMLDDRAWEEELAFIKSLAAEGDAGRVGRGWRFNREEVYEDRISKILR